jgi:hypothetical protein
MSLIEDLKATRQALESRGRCTRTLLDYEGRVCILGAVAAATVDNFEQWVQVDGFHHFTTNDRAKAVVSKIRAYLDAQTFEVKPIDRVWLWNDAPTTTDADVFNLLDKALADEGGLV